MGISSSPSAAQRARLRLEEQAERRDMRRLFGAAATAAGVLAVSTATMTLIGWAADMPSLRRAGLRFPPMMPIAAAALLGLGLSLILLAGRTDKISGWIARSVALLAGAVGLATVIQYAFPVDLGIDLLVFGEAASAGGFIHPGRMRPASAAATVLLATALAAYDMESERVHRIAEIFVMAVAVIALETLFRYAFGMDALYGRARQLAMPLHMAVALLGLAAGTALLRPARGRFRILANSGAAGVALRRLIPVSVAGPFVMGWLTYLLVMRDLVSAVTGLTLFMSVMCVLLLAAVGWTIRELNRIDAQRLALLQSEREARDEAEEANAAKSKFLGVVSHELRTPLNSVLAYADLLDAGIAGPLTEGQKGYVKRIEASGSHLRSMIEELLQFTRSQRGTLEADLRAADAVALAREALSVVAHEVHDSAVELKHELPAERIEIRTDPEKVLHVLVNLLGNGLKFTTQGAVGLRLTRIGHKVIYEVWDTGPGIPFEDRSRIFQEFAQLDTGVNGRKGMGLGLAIVKSYAALVGGRLEVNSKVGEGSVFRLVLLDAVPMVDGPDRAAHVTSRSTGGGDPG